MGRTRRFYQKKNNLYTFKGEESFQPLTSFESTKCKRCGFYEEDRFTSDDVFDEWEFCPSDFESDDGQYVRAKSKEFNATFLSHECVKKGTGKSSDNASHAHEENGMHWSTKLIIGISVTVLTVLLIMGLCVNI
ncbi:uncharacterized protein LOC143637246 [Bidens hawaiensis]|uniref:uncharacterized protein LOC143637246 n=1 Tax=Bidens hawaiensis TaxID=980011 RepID=UPI00404B154F